MSGLFASSGAELSALGSVFVKLLNISIAAGWIVLAAVLLRKLLKRAPKWAVCLLWLVLALRLVLPFSIESPLSLVPSAETVVVTESRAPAESASPASQSGGFSLDETTASPGFSVEIHSGFATVNSFVNPIISGAEGSGRAQQSDAAGQPGSAEERSPAAPSEGAARSASLAGLIDGLGAVWAAGVIALLAYGAISFAGLRRKVRASVPWPQAAAGSTDGRALGSAFASRPQEAGKASPRRLRVLICDDIDSPFILGILRPKVYLPSGLSDAEIEHILSHEQAHIARRDHLWKPLGFALLAVYWFNPLMWLAYALFCRDIELACDEKVVRAMDEGGKAAYSRTLVSCSSRQRLVTACPLAFGEVGTGERVKSVLNYKRPAFWIITLAVIVCIVLAVCFLTNPKSGGSGSKDGSNVQGQVYVWFDSVSYSGKTGYESEVLEQADGTEVTRPDFPGISFKTNLKANTKTIYMIKDGTAVPVIDDYTLILNAFFCDINGDGKPELCTSGTFGSGFIDERIKVYDIAADKQYELADRGNYDYSLVQRNGWLVVMKRYFETTSSVGSDTRLILKNGKLDLAPLSEETRAVLSVLREESLTSYSEPPKLKISWGQNTESVSAQLYNWPNYILSETSNVTADWPGPEQLDKDGKLGTIQVSTGEKVMLSIGAKPERVSVHYRYGVSKMEQYLRMDPSDESFTLPENEEGYLIVRAGWTEGGIAFDATYVIKVLGTSELTALDEARQGKVYIWFDSLKDSGWRSVSEDVLKAAEGSQVELPEYPNARFQKVFLEPIGKSLIEYEMDGTDVVTMITDYAVLNAFFCDLNEDGKPELCATCLSDPDASARFILIYDIENYKYYELSERGFDYTLAERNGLLIAMKRTHQEESSVGADVVLAIKDGRLAMAPLGDDAGTVVQLSPVNLISGNSNMVKTGEKYTITVDGTPYYLVTKGTSYLPFGYTQVGTISKEQAGKSFVAGLPYFRAAGHDDIYVYAEHAVTPGDLMLSSEIYIGYMHFTPDKDAVWTMTLDDVLFLADKGNITRDDLKSFVTLDREATKGESYSIRIDDMYSVFVRFDGTGRADMFKLGKYDFTEVVNVLTEDVQAFIDAHYVVDIIDTAEVHATALEKFWESGGLEFWFPSIQSEGMYVVTADGNRTPLKEALEDRLILVTDIPRFGHKVYIGGLYEGELTGLTPDAARLAQLKAYAPQFFGVDSSKGLTIYVYSLASQHYSCGILPGDAQGVDMIGSSQSGSLTRDDVLLILKSEYPDVPDSKITVRPYFNPISSYLVIDKEAYANQLKALFGGRFKVGSSIGFMVNDPDNTAQAGVQPSAEQKRTPEHITALESESPALDKGFAGESIEVLLGSKPDMTGRVMHVFVTSFGPNEYNCIIYMNARYAALPQVPVNAKSYSVGEVKQLITNWGLSDEQVVLYNYQHPMSSYIDEMGEEHLKAISAQFDDKYPVVDNGETHYYKYLNSIEHALD